MTRDSAPMTPPRDKAYTTEEEEEVVLASQFQHHRISEQHNPTHNHHPNNTTTATRMDTSHPIDSSMKPAIAHLVAPSPLVQRIGNYYLTTRVIGEGSNATVYEGFLPSTSIIMDEEESGSDSEEETTRRPAPVVSNGNAKVAIKVVDKTKLSEEKKADLMQEIKILRAVQGHPAIVQLHYVHETPHHFYLVFEHKSMDLYSFIRKYRPIPENKVKYIFTQLVSALDHCHKLGICHRDVKIENVLIDERTLKVSLCDFGFATFFKRDERLSKWCGSPHTVAPEIILRTPYDPIAADFWSLGSILYALICGSFPFQARTYRDIFHRTTMGMYHGLPSFVSAGARDLIARMLRVDSKQRLSAPQVLMHPWMRQP